MTIKAGAKVVFTNQQDAIFEYISTNVPIESLSAMAGMAVAYRLAMMSAPLITGKGAKALLDNLKTSYAATKAEAQEHDRNENFEFVDASIRSEFVKERTS